VSFENQSKVTFFDSDSFTLTRVFTLTALLSFALNFDSHMTWLWLLTLTLGLLTLTLVFDSHMTLTPWLWLNKFDSYDCDAMTQTHMYDFNSYSQKWLSEITLKNNSQKWLLEMTLINDSQTCWLWKMAIHIWLSEITLKNYCLKLFSEMTF